jgi:hypothetical protein
MFCHFYSMSIHDFLGLTLSQTRALLKAVPTSSEWSDKFGDFKG